MRLIIASALTAICLGCATASQPLPESTLKVEELVENPDKYDQKQVIVYGYVHYGFEGCTIDPIDEKGKITNHPYTYSLWYYLKDCMLETKNFKGGPGVLYGTFHKDDKGHLGSYTASVVVSRLEWR